MKKHSCPLCAGDCYETHKDEIYVCELCGVLFSYDELVLMTDLYYEIDLNDWFDPKLEPVLRALNTGETVGLWVAYRLLRDMLEDKGVKV